MMDNFIPELPQDSVVVPFFEDAKSEDGWQGHATTKSIKALQSEITQAMARLGGMVTGFQSGSFVGEKTRNGFRIHYIIETPDGKGAIGRLDIAALPVKEGYLPRMSPVEVRREKSLRMALYMLRIALDGTWFLQQLSPGYSALMPFMIGPGNRTISQWWAESPIMSNLLPPETGDEFMEGNYSTAKQE